MKPALLIIDLQKAFHKGTAKPFMDRAVTFINYVRPYFENKHLPVVWIQHIDEEDGVVEGTEGFAFIDELGSNDSSVRFYKTYGNAFNKTGLHAHLQSFGVDTLVLTGYCAENCVLSTYKGSQDLDYTPILLRDGIASRDLENQRFVEKICNGISADALIKVLENC